MYKIRRTMLFIPGNNPGMLQTAALMGADTIILDLEDAVAVTEKDSARILVREALKAMDFSKIDVYIRINPIDTVFGERDLKEIVKYKPNGILVPKSNEEAIKITEEIITDLEAIEGIEKRSIKLMALIESAYGVENTYSIVKTSSRIEGVLLGGEDLTVDMGVKRTKEGEEILYARAKVATACKAAKVMAIDTPFTDTNDFEGLIKDSQKGKVLGMSGKAAINPRQVRIIHKVYSPTEEEINHALRVIEALEDAERKGTGVFSLDGKMVDAPIINRARNVIKAARQLGKLGDK